jgi:predicted RNA-binding protein with PIN domain
MNRLLVDGYNVAHKMGIKISAPTLTRVREHVERLLLSYAMVRKSRITLIYDGKGKIGSRETNGSLEIEFTPENQTADSRIKELIDESLSKTRLMVVSSDLNICHYARISGVKSISSEAFLKEAIEVVQPNTLQQKHLRKKSHHSQEKPNTPSQKEMGEWLKLFGK